MEERALNAPRRDVREIIITVLVVVGMAFTLLAQMFDNSIHIRHYSIYSSKVDKTLKILMISDLHSYIFSNDQDILVRKIASEKPDLIALCGDIADDDVPIKGTDLLLKGIKGVAPIYYVLGNHEYWDNDVDGIIAVFKSYGVTVLSDELTDFKKDGHNVLIGGITDPIANVTGNKRKNHNELKEAYKSVKSDKRYSILLAHRPENYTQYEEYGFDLALCGHAHGGQVRIPPIINGLYAPNQGWFPKRAGGLYYSNGMNQVVSRGLVINPRLPRIFNPPEICVIEIRKS